MLNKEEVKNKANNILEDTKMEKEEYCEERKVIFSLLKNKESDFNIEILDEIIKIVEKNRLMKKENKKFSKIKDLKEKIKKQKLREEDDVNSPRIAEFLIKDKNGNEYTFLTRENAEEYIKAHEKIFDKKVNIQVIQNKNLDIESIFND